jgi:hypothetical protein
MNVFSSKVSVRYAFFALTLAACGGGENGDDADPPPTDAPVTLATCDEYCTEITANCTGSNLMYESDAECMASCELFAPGAGADTSGNTLGCRAYHARAAADSQTNADTHCRHAGPGGDGACGSNCEGFCKIVQAACADQNQPPYADLAACMTACQGYAPTPEYSALGPIGDNFACRLYHATFAIEDPAFHCSHASVNSPTCQD